MAHGISESHILGFWPSTTVSWKTRFYATAEGACYSLANGDYMPKTSVAFKSYLETNISSQEQENKYISMMENAKKF